MSTRSLRDLAADARELYDRIEALDFDDGPEPSLETLARRIAENLEAHARVRRGPPASPTVQAAMLSILRLGIEHPGERLYRVNDMEWQARTLDRSILANAMSKLRLFGFVEPASRRGQGSPIVVTEKGREAHERRQVFP